MTLLPGLSDVFARLARAGIAAALPRRQLRIGDLGFQGSEQRNASLFRVGHRISAPDADRSIEEIRP
jgi:hypothetical protein